MLDKNLRKILIVDDDLAIRTSLQQILEFEGYSAFCAENGRVGLALARSHLPDLILLDMMMPEMNGQEFLEVWERDPDLSKIPVIVLSVSKLEGKLTPRVKKMNKPVDLELLFKTISESMGNV